jgi:Putative peptidoglycan binding domain
MSSAAYAQWLAAGKPFNLAYPCADLMNTLRRQGYTVYAYPDGSHLTASTPEDHCPFSATGWPIAAPRWWGDAIDIMPPRAGSGLPSLAQLGAQLAADKNNGFAGAEPIKYLNWTPAGMECRHESWEPGHNIRPSSDVGHVHMSIRSDRTTSRAMLGYDPVARIRAGGGVIPVVVHPVENGGAPAWPGRILAATSPMLHGTDVSTWQAQMRRRGWPITVDGWYGPGSASICRQFQRDSNAHHYPLDVDGKVGPNTWRAAWQRPVS